MRALSRRTMRAARSTAVSGSSSGSTAASASRHHVAPRRYSSGVRAASDAYKSYLERYPHDKNAYELGYYLAETYYYSLRFDDAVAAYEKDLLQDALKSAGGAIIHDSHNPYHRVFSILQDPAATRADVKVESA